jgi:HlyD family secretion protein
MSLSRRRRFVMAGAALLVMAGTAARCRGQADANAARASGYVEATEVRLAPEVGGRLLEVAVKEGDRLKAGDVVARLDDTDTAIATKQAQAERDQAVAQLRLLQAGARAEDIRQARAHC